MIAEFSNPDVATNKKDLYKQVEIMLQLGGTETVWIPTKFAVAGQNVIIGKNQSLGKRGRIMKVYELELPFADVQHKFKYENNI